MRSEGQSCTLTAVPPRTLSACRFTVWHHLAECGESKLHVVEYLECGRVLCKCSLYSTWYYDVLLKKKPLPTHRTSEAFFIYPKVPCPRLQPILCGIVRSMTSSLLVENLLENHVLGFCRAFEFMMNDQVLRKRGSQFRRRSSYGHQ